VILAGRFFEKPEQGIECYLLCCFSDIHQLGDFQFNDEFFGTFITVDGCPAHLK
jgi:hypothetical protein